MKNKYKTGGKPKIDIGLDGGLCTKEDGIKKLRCEWFNLAQDRVCDVFLWIR
jgi:hypothetical protein